MIGVVTFLLVSSSAWRESENFNQVNYLRLSTITEMQVEILCWSVDSHTANMTVDSVDSDAASDNRLYTFLRDVTSLSSVSLEMSRTYEDSIILSHYDK